MTRRKLISGTLALAVAVVIGFALTGGPGNDDPGSSSSAEAAAKKSSGGTKKGNEDSDSKERKEAIEGSDGEGSEVIKQPEGSGKDGLPGLSRTKPSKTGSLISRPLPKTATSRGSIVRGFPLKVVPVAPGSAVQLSGVSSTKSSLQVSLRAKSSRSPNAVLAFYRGKLAAQGFKESAVPSVGGSTASSFARNADNLVVTVTKSRSKGTTYSVFGTLHTGKSR